LAGPADGQAGRCAEENVMPTYKAPVDDVMFLLSDVFHIDRYNNLPGFADATPDLLEAVLAEAAKFCEDVLTPLNRVGDKEGCRRHDDGSVSTPSGFKDAYKRLNEAGWMGAAAPAEFGGQDLPTALAQAINEFTCSANMAFAMYPGLTLGAAAALATHGSAEQKATYLPKLISGQWTGTMNLTEPQCGTDLGLVRTRAVPQPDGSYKITGTKIFISAGEHDLAEYRCSSSPNSCSARTAPSALATASPAARSKRRWASTATPPA
jgi:acyl-CoA dehydrogenase